MTFELGKQELKEKSILKSTHSLKFIKELVTLSIFTLSYSQGEPEQTKKIFQTFITGVFMILKDSPFEKLYKEWQT